MTVNVAEQFFSLQGEGPFAGTPAVFLRLAGCNLKCGLAPGDSVTDFEKGQEPTADGATWICDTIDVWRDPENRYDPGQLVHEWGTLGWTNRLEAGAHVILTGGEPTLQLHQDASMAFLDRLEEFMAEPPFVEVETNGTIRPDDAYLDVVDHFNVSVKLQNSGMDRDDRINPEAMEYYADRWVDGADPTAVFKFVVGGEADMDEIHGLISEFDIPYRQVMLMPAGQTREQLRETYPVVAELCKENGCSFSPRLHVTLWDQATGV